MSFFPACADCEFFEPFDDARTVVEVLGTKDGWTPFCGKCKRTSPSIHVVANTICGVGVRRVVPGAPEFVCALP